jgi:hypothetical protein
MNRKEAIKEEVAIPFSDADLLEYLPHAPIKKYSELAQYKTLYELLPEVKSFCILLYEDSINKGHWTVVSRPEEGLVEFFCSYGSYPDSPLKWTEKSTRIGLGSGVAYLGKLFQECPDMVVYNKIHYQKEKPGVSNCGRYCVLRTLKMKAGMNLDQFYKYMKKECKRLRTDFDGAVTLIIQ